MKIKEVVLTFRQVLNVLHSLIESLDCQRIKYTICLAGGFDTCLKIPYFIILVFVGLGEISVSTLWTWGMVFEPVWSTSIVLQ